jgi:hypothetical protein
VLSEEKVKESEMQIPSRIFAEGELENNKRKFIVYFLYDDEDQSVRVEEFEEIDLAGVTRHLSIGGSVFIARRRDPQSYGTSYAEERLIENEPAI